MALFYFIRLLSLLYLISLALAQAMPLPTNFIGYAVEAVPGQSMPAYPRES